jgi:hypothetical protein
LIGTPGNEKASPQEAAQEEVVNLGLAAGVTARCKVLGQLGVADWHRWFHVIYFEVRAQATSGGVNKDGVDIHGREDSNNNNNSGNGSSNNNNNNGGTTCGSSTIGADTRSKVVKAEARAQLNKIMRAWCHQNSHGRVLSPRLFLRHVCARPNLKDPLSNLSDSLPYHQENHRSFGGGGGGGGGGGVGGGVGGSSFHTHQEASHHHDHSHEHGNEHKSGTGAHDHDFSGFCLVKLNWEVGFGGLASFHLGFFNVDVSTRVRLTEELQRSLTRARNMPSMYFEVTGRSLAAKLVDWSGLIKPDPMDASGRDDARDLQQASSDSASSSAALSPKTQDKTSKAMFERNREFNRIKVAMPRSAAKLLVPPMPTPKPAPAQVIGTFFLPLFLFFNFFSHAALFAHYFDV